MYTSTKKGERSMATYEPLVLCHTQQPTTARRKEENFTAAQDPLAMP